MPRKRDSRTYITVHDGMPDHPKVDGLSDPAFRLLVEMWCWCSRHLTDGVVPAVTWGKRGSVKARRELVDAGLADPDPDGTVRMHDYLEHQRSAEEVRELSEKRAEAGRKGGNSKARGVASAKQPSPPLPSKDVAESVSDTELLSTKATGGAVEPRKQRRTRISDTFEIEPGMRLWAAENTPAVDVDLETRQFMDHHQAKGSVMADWTKAWFTWMRNADRWRRTPARGAQAETDDFFERAMARAIEKDSA